MQLLNGCMGATACGSMSWKHTSQKQSPKHGLLTRHLKDVESCRALWPVESHTCNGRCDQALRGCKLCAPLSCGCEGVVVNCTARAHAVVIVWLQHGLKTVQVHDGHHAITMLNTHPLWATS